MRFLFLLISAANLFAMDYPNEEHPNYNFYLDFPNEYYVETGASGGGSIIRALEARNSHGYFRYIYSIDCNPQSVEFCKHKFHHRFFLNIKLFLGDSSTELWNMIKDIPNPITFWLDAHRFPPEEDGKKNCPLLEELEQIGRHPINTHTILIDDIPCCGTAAFDYITAEDLIKKILQINPEYKIKFIYSQILVATPPN